MSWDIVSQWCGPFAAVLSAVALAVSCRRRPPAPDARTLEKVEERCVACERRTAAAEVEMTECLAKAVRVQQRLTAERTRVEAANAKRNGGAGRTHVVKSTGEEVPGDLADELDRWLSAEGG